MTFRALVRACISLRASALAVLAMLALPAHAVPPAFTGAPIVANPSGTQIFINLRQQGVVTGSAPLTVTVGQLIINGAVDPSGVIGIDPTDPLPLDGGAVCLELEDEGFDPGIHLTAAIQLQITNPLNQSATATVPITLTPGPTVSQVDPQCSDPNATPTANAGADRTIVDTDAQPGETVVLDASASTDANADNILTYQWFEDGEFPVAGPSTSPVLSAQLAPGVHDLTLVVTDDSGDGATSTGIDDVTITIAAPQIPTVNAGLDRNVPDSDRNPGETVTLTGSAIDIDGAIVSFEWFLGTNSLGTGATIQTRLQNGVNDITLRVADNAGNIGVDTVRITVEVPVQRPTLTQLPNLDPTQQRTASALDRICTELDTRDDVATATLTPEQRDLLNRCNGIYFNNSAGNQIRALEELIADDFAVARTQTLLFANTQYVSVMDRLIALRGGARGLSIAGLNIVVDGKSIPLAKLQDLAETLFGGGASADEPGGLLSDKWGMWARGNYSFGDKETSRTSPSFDADQWSIVGGLDYRLSNSAVLGGSIAYGESSIEFTVADEGALDTESWAVSLYGSVYAAKNFYFDGIVNVANSGYDAERNITYVDGTGLVTADATGDTDGLTLSGGLSGGYDFLVGGLTISPSLGFFYIDTTIDGFTEAGAGGLNLIYDEQKFESLTGNLGLRATYAWNLSWGVLLPHVRADYIREFEDDVDVFGVRFAADPNAASTPPILVETDNPDQSYWRLSAGFSAQFKYGVSGYIEYQRLESFEFINFQDVAIGLRMQRSF